MSRRSKETLAVQLFPFLAVLVCTMGSLIFLLLVTTREIRQRAIAFAEFQQSQQLEQPVVEAQSLPVLSIPAPEPKPEPVPVESLPKRVSQPITPPDDGYDAELAQRELELNNLKSSWRTRANLLAVERDHQRKLLSRRRSLVVSAQNKVVTLESEVKNLELELGRLAGETAAATEKIDENERILLEQQIALMKKKLRAAQVADATSQHDQFQVVPFDPQTGTNRRPILMECTAAGIRFLPEDILITADDMRGFTTKVNPLAAGTGALINYWTAMNLRQRLPQAEPEPYVLMLVRPDGVFAYYVAMKMLEPIRTAQGYELVEESTVLKLPEVDAGAKSACQTAVNRLLSERENIQRAAIGGGSGGTVFGGSPGRNGTSSGGSPRGSNSSGTGDSSRTGGSTFGMTDITGGDNAVGNRSWERIENFQGRHQAGQRRSGVTGDGTNDPFEGASNGTGATASDGIESSSPDESWSDPRNPRADKTGKRGNSASRNTAAGNGSSVSNGSFGSSAGGIEPEPGMPVGERPGRKSKRPSEADDADLADPMDEMEAGTDSEGDGSVGGEPGGTSRQRSASSGSSSRISNNGSSGRFSHNPRNSTRAARPGEKPSKSDEAADKPLEPEMLAGRRWGVCDVGASIGFEREVRVDVSSDKLVIAEKHVIPVEEGDSKTEILERFATALDLYSREWGRPPQGFFWAPRLKFVVKPEGNGRYEQINAMMTRAGLATSHEFAKNSNSIQFGRVTPATTKPSPKTVVVPRSGGHQ